MTQDMKTIYGHQATGSCGLTEEARKCALRGANMSSRFAKFILRFAAVLLLMVVGVSGVKGQTGTDYSGTYYIASDAVVSGKHIYNADDHTNNYYLCPTEEWISFDSSGTTTDTWTTGDAKPFLTTHMINAHDGYDKSKAKWIVEYYTTENEKDYYYIKHSSGKYLVLNKQISGVDGNNKQLRIRLHLESLNQAYLENEDTRNNALFRISRDGNDYLIDPKTQYEYYLTVNKGNGDPLQGENRGGGGQITNTTYYLAGTLGIFQGPTDANKYFYLEEIIPRPTFTNTSSQININHSEENTTIYYTTDGTNPTTTHYNGKGPAPLQINMPENSVTIKAIAAGTDNLPSCISKIRVVPAANIILESSPIVYNGSAQEPTVIVKDGETIIPSDEYTVSYSNNTNAGENTAVVTITDKDGGDYIVYGSCNFTINPASVSLIANSRNTDVYDGSEKTVTGFTCKKGEQTMEGLTFTGVSASGSGTDAGTYDVTFSGVTVNTTKDDTGNYVVTEATNGVLTINPASVTLTGNSRDTDVYDGTEKTVSGFTCSVDGLTFTGVSASGSGTNAGTYDVTFSGLTVNTTKDDTGNYVVTETTNGALTINPASVTLTANSRDTDVYDGTEKTVTGFTSSVDGLTFTGVSATGSGTDAGTYDVTFSGVTVNTTKDDIGNYVVTETTNGTLTIDQKEVGLDWSSASLTYNGNAQAPTATATGVVNGDDVSVTVTGTQTNVGTGYTATASELTGTKAGNYKLPAANTTTFEITAKAVTITANNASKTYNSTALTESGFTASALEDGDEHTFTVVMTEGSTIINIGTQPNVIATVDGVAVTTGTETVVGNYKVTTADGTLTVNAKAVTITANDATKEYDGEPLTESGFTASALEEGDTHTFTVVMTAESTITNVGTPQPNVIATVDGVPVTTGVETAVGNYLVTTVNGTLTVTKKLLKITADSGEKVYDGTALTKDTYTYEGALYSGDAITSVTVTGSQTIAGSSDNVPSAAVIKNDSGNGDDVTENYEITYVNGTLTVTKKALTITADSDAKEYDGTALTKNTYTITNNTTLATGDEITSVTVTGSQTDAGTSDNVPSDAVIKNSASEDVTACYEITYNNGTLEVTRAAATVTAEAKTKEYGEDDPTFTATVTGLKNNEAASVLTYTFSRTEGENVGEYTITPAGDAEQGNYTVTYETGTLTITRATATVTADDKTKGFGDADPTFTATVTGLKNNEEASVLAFTFSRVEGEDVGGYTITPSGDAEQGNYNVTYATGTLTITAKDIGDGTDPAEGIDIDITYDGTDYTVTVKQGDNTIATTNYTCNGAYDQDHPENYVITVTGQGNYTNSAKATYTRLTFYDTTPDDATIGTTAAVYCASQNLKVNESFEAYYVTSVANNALTLTKVEAGESKKNYIVANQPMILISDAATAPKGFTVKPYTDTEEVTIPDTGEGSNLLKVVTDAGGLAVNLAQVYMFSQGEFVLTKAGTMPKGKFYLENPNYNTPAPSRSSLRIVSDDATGIATSPHIDTDSEIIDTWYTIGGQKLNKKPTRKGLYLQNGKKVVIK